MTKILKKIKQLFMVMAFLSSLSINAMQHTSEKTREGYFRHAYSDQVGLESYNGEKLKNTQDPLSLSKAEEILIKASDLENSHAAEAFNYSDLLPYNSIGQNELAKKAGISQLPAAAHFYENSNECLRYIAVVHVAGPKPSGTETGDTTFVMIQKAFNTYKPDFVIAEGFTSEPHFVEHIASICDNEPGESMYTVQLAKANNIPFTGGEPTDFTILKGIQRPGYTAEDMAAFYITRQLPQLWRNRNPILQGPDDLEAAIQNIILYHIGHFMPGFTYDQWQAWIIRHYGRVLEFKKLISGELTEPRADGTILEELAHETGLVRDREILSRILELKDRGFERILVVYGGSHYYTQHKVLENYFGKPTYTVAPHNIWHCLSNCTLF